MEENGVAEDRAAFLAYLQFNKTDLIIVLNFIFLPDYNNYLILINPNMSFWPLIIFQWEHFLIC